MRPVIFVSAVTRELKSSRRLAAATLHAIGYDSDWEDIFDTAHNDLLELLRQKIDRSAAVLQIVGLAYGAEPTTSHEQFGRVSFTHYEALYARSRNKPVYILLTLDSYPSDEAPAAIDSPRSSSGEIQFHADDRRRLQEAYRDTLRCSGQVYYLLSDTRDLELTIRRLSHDLDKLRHGYRRWMATMTAGLFLVASLAFLLTMRQSREGNDIATQGAMLAKAGGDLSRQSQTLTEIKQHLDLDPTRIREQLNRLINSAYDKQLRTVDAVTDWKKREDARASARATRDDSLSRVDSFIATITSAVGENNASPELIELTRILQEQGPEQAIEYIAACQARLFTTAELRVDTSRVELRRMLEPLLAGVSLSQTSGNLRAAHATGERLLAIEPQWPEALHAHASTLIQLGDQAVHFESTAAAVDYWKDAVRFAERLRQVKPDYPDGPHTLWAAYNKCGFGMRQSGQFREAALDYERGLAIAKAVAHERIDDSRAQRDLAISYELMAEGSSAARALELLGKCLQIRESLVLSDSDDFRAQCDLAVVFQKLGDACRRTGRLAETRAWLAKALAVSERLVTTAPESSEARRHLMVSHDKLGDCERAAHEWNEAARQYRMAIEIAQKAAVADPADLESRRDLWVLNDGLGDCARNTGQVKDAITYFTKARDIVDGLVEQDPTNLQFRRDLLVAYERLGVANGEAGNSSEARVILDAGLRLAQDLADNNPQDIQIRRSLMLLCNKLGLSLQSAENENSALELFEKGRESAARLVKDDPGDATAEVDMIISHYLVGSSLRALERFADARVAFDIGLASADRMIKSKVQVAPSSELRDDLSKNASECKVLAQAVEAWSVVRARPTAELSQLLNIRIALMARQARVNDVLQSADCLESLEPTTAVNLYNAACGYGLCLKLLVGWDGKGKFTGASDELRSVTGGQQREISKKAIASLRRAIDAGYSDFHHMANDPDLVALHGTIEFKALLQAADGAPP